MPVKRPGLRGLYWILAGHCLALGLRCLFAPIVSPDVRGFILPWYEILREQGAAALGTNFSDYSPCYLYLLYLGTWLHPWLAPVWTIKLLAAITDFANAIIMFRLLRLKYPRGDIPWRGYFAVLLVPTLLFNGAWWGQCDGIYAGLLLASTYACLRGKPLAAMVLIGLSLSFKQQAVFLGPFILLALSQGLLRWRHVWVPAAVYLVSVLPCAAMGRPFIKLMTIYLDQAKYYASMCMNAANPYFFLGERTDTYLLVSALLIAGLGASAFVWLSWRRQMQLTPEHTLLAATISAALMPFLLPRMHERYFFAADLFALALAYQQPAFWPVAACFQVTSLLSYGPFLGWWLEWPIYIAVVLNGFALIFLLSRYFATKYPRIADTLPDAAEGPLLSPIRAEAA